MDSSKGSSTRFPKESSAESLIYYFRFVSLAAALTPRVIETASHILRSRLRLSKSVPAIFSQPLAVARLNLCWFATFSAADPIINHLLPLRQPLVAAFSQPILEGASRVRSPLAIIVAGPPIRRRGGEVIASNPTAQPPFSCSDQLARSDDPSSYRRPPTKDPRMHPEGLEPSTY
jgi:hypothetical protein